MKTFYIIMLFILVGGIHGLTVEKQIIRANTVDKLEVRACAELLDAPTDTGTRVQAARACLANLPSDQK